MYALRTQGHPSDDIVTFSLRGETRGSPPPEDILRLTPSAIAPGFGDCTGGSPGGTRPSSLVLFGHPR